MNRGGPRDVISDLPEALCCHILSFLPTKEAASTSVLSKKWRYLFANVPNLDFDDSVYVNPREERKFPTSPREVTRMFYERKNKVSTSFMDFVDRVLALQGNSPLHKLSLKVTDGVDPLRINSWIDNVLERGVSDLDLDIGLESEFFLTSKIFLSKTLVELKLTFGYSPTLDVKDVHLPKLKTLYLNVESEEHGFGLTKLLSGCHMLEDLVLDEISRCIWDDASVSVTTLKRLTCCWEDRAYDNATSVSLDTPNLVYLKFTDTIADKYLKVNFNSLVEAHINLRMSEEQMGLTDFLEEATFEDLQIHYSEGYGENDLIGNATEFIMGLCNVKILSLSANTLRVLTYSCEAIPLFNNLTHLTIESKPKIGWQSLPALLKNSPNLETLVFQGLVHKAMDSCGDVCLCKPCEEGIPSCLSSSPVKVLKILKFGEIGHYYDGIDIRQIKYFLETMPNLEQMILYYDTPVDKDVIEVSSQLERLVSKVASSKCIVQVISDNLSLSSTLSTNRLLFFRSPFPV
ncbi:PREDICTED: F-box/LRR-repeat protein At4g14103-like [Camelina sativa]|uniref:F-box/LRR-repeat protein At4g14103-like n=1 Tax=Camelina sativa TaxID=90675 RepID=A0ABM0Z930_CAMSA|nr:PREDICTED: F-box/LRR-repeat protein At4g14103-like [Camelina sativa]XP_019101671.1 PREDICTED: F-box/LRR-repeat protein At4g14103-like [Camelina sativa]